MDNEKFMISSHTESSKKIDCNNLNIIYNKMKTQKDYLSKIIKIYSRLSRLPIWVGPGGLQYGTVEKRIRRNLVE